MSKKDATEAVELLMEHIETLTAHTVVQREIIIMMLGMAVVRERQPKKLIMEITEMVREGIIGQEYTDPSETSYSRKVEAEIERIQNMAIEGLETGEEINAKLASRRASSD